jgi:hypothetical protein
MNYICKLGKLNKISKIDAVGLVGHVRRDGLHSCSFPTVKYS